MSSINYDDAKDILEREFKEVETHFLAGETPEVDPSLIPSFDEIFQSRTQSNREALLGCILVRILDKSVDIHKPYVDQASNAYSGRTLDERVVNPFLHNKRIPSSKGPFLAVFRRGVDFTMDTRPGISDKDAFDAFLVLIENIEGEDDDRELINFLHYLLYRFLKLREKSEIPLLHLQRISLEQYDNLITGLLETQSGGRFPVLLIKAAFMTLKTIYRLSWKIEVTGINVADKASGKIGDLTIRDEGRILLGAEITERTVGKDRLISIFTTKIGPQSIEDYLFFIRADVDDEVKAQARQYFSQGHEVNFLEMKTWILMVLATIGKEGRDLYNRIMLEELSTEEIPSTLKTAWNEQIAKISTT
jgi:hypothetical protein